MRIAWFEVTSYKNLRKPMRLEALGRLNVLHGDNNVGKSNLLESIGLLFVAIEALREEAGGATPLTEAFARNTAPDASSRSVFRSAKFLGDRGFPPDDIFRFDDPTPIELRAGVQFDDGDRTSSSQVALPDSLEVGVRATRREDGVVFTLVRLVLPNGSDFAGPTNDGAIPILKLLGRRFEGRAATPRYALVRTDRSVLSDPPMQNAAPLVARDPMPPDLGLALHQAEMGKDMGRRRFEQFTAALDQIRSVVGEGRWRMIYDPDTERAELYLERAREMIPLRLMGSGVQQIAVLAGRLVMMAPAIIAIEEPELNLRWALQHVLRDVLRTLCEGDHGPRQLFITSHSPAFEFEPMFYALVDTPTGPEVRRRPSAEAPRHLNPEVLRPAEGEGAPLSYVTREGLVRLPDDVREALQLTTGGGVAFVKGKDNHYYMLTDNQLWNLVEPEGDGS